jgi:hypothetical protein
MFSLSEDSIMTLVWSGMLLFSGLLLVKLFAQAFLPEEHWLARIMAHVTLGKADLHQSGGDSFGSGGCGGDGGGGGD